MIGERVVIHTDRINDMIRLCYDEVKYVTLDVSWILYPLFKSARVYDVIQLSGVRIFMVINVEIKVTNYEQISIL